MRLLPRARTGWFAAFLVLAGACAGSFRESEISPDPDDLACDSDEDCRVANSDIRSCCAFKTTVVQSFAISKRALEAIRAECASDVCPMMLVMSPGVDDPNDFMAVCVRRSCRLRPAPPPDPFRP